MKTSDFYFDLPEELIAQDPLEDRTSSKLLVLNKETGYFTEEDEETGEGFRVGLQLNGEILNQSIEVDFNEIADDLIEMRHITDDKEVIIELL